MSANRAKVISIFAILLIVLSSFAFFQDVKAQPSVPKNFEVVKSPYVEEYNVHWEDSGLMGIGVDGKGYVWFYMLNRSSVGRFSPSQGSFDEYPITAKAAVPMSIALVAGGQLAFDDKGRVWFTDALRNSIGMLDPSASKMQMYPIPTPNSGPLGILYDPSGFVWFTEVYGDKIGRLNIGTGLLEEYPLHISESSGPAMLYMDREGKIWFTEAFGERIGYIETSKTTEGEFTLHEFTPSGLRSPVGIAVLNGVVWIADHGGSDLISYVPSNGTTRRYTTSPAQAYPESLPNQIVLDKEGRLWFTEHGGNRIAMIQPHDGTMTEYVIPTGPLAITLWLAISPSQEIWFTEYAANKIGVVKPLQQDFVSITTSNHTVSLHAGDSKELQIFVNSSITSASSVELRVVQSGQAGEGITAEIEPRTLLLNPGSPQEARLSIRIDSNAEVGEGILFIQVAAASVIQSKAIDVQVGKSESSSTISMMFLIVPAIIVVGGYLYYRYHKRRKTPAASL